MFFYILFDKGFLNVCDIYYRYNRIEDFGNFIYIIIGYIYIMYDRYRFR